MPRLARMTTAVCPIGAAPALAQDRPFVFSLATSPDATSHRAMVGIDFGAGEQTFKNSVDNGPEERLAVRAFDGRFTFAADVGAASVAGAYDTSQQAELLYTIAPSLGAGFSLAAGGGVLHEADDATVRLGRIVASRATDRTQTIGNVLCEHPDSPMRDPVDVIATAGWASRLTPDVSLGIEGIGEDLEGFWDATEAEGGARILVGPSLHVAPAGRRWELSLAGGPTFHPTTSPRSSSALRDLPATTAGTSYAIRIGFDCKIGQ